MSTITSAKQNRAQKWEKLWENANGFTIKSM